MQAVEVPAAVPYKSRLVAVSVALLVVNTPVSAPLANTSAFEGVHGQAMVTDCFAALLPVSPVTVTTYTAVGKLRFCAVTVAIISCPRACLLSWVPAAQAGAELSSLQAFSLQSRRSQSSRLLPPYRLRTCP